MYVDSVNFGGFTAANRPVFSLLAYFLCQKAAFFITKFFRISQAINRLIAIQDDRCGNYRTNDTTAPNFIEANNPL
jgi:hypothetical protein